MIKTLIDSIVVFIKLSHLVIISLFGNRTSTKSKHLALFAWALPHNSNAGVYRPLSFIRYGDALGWKITAFRGRVPKNQSQHGDELLARVPFRVDLNEIPSSNRRPSYRLFPRIDGGYINALDCAEFAIRTMQSNPPKVVLASGPPFFTFVSAYWVSKYFKAPLILDYRDEWTECPFDFVDAGRDDRKWEKKCIKHSAAIFFTTKSHLLHQLEVFPELNRNKAFLVPNGWEPSDFEINNSPQAQVTDKKQEITTLSHIGALGGHTPPNDFLASLSKLVEHAPNWGKRLKLNFIGRISSEAQVCLNSYSDKIAFEVAGHVGKRQASCLMQNSDILLLIATEGLTRYLPGKLYDYIAADRPILVFGFEGEASNLVEKLGVGVFCPNNSSTYLKTALERLTQWSVENRSLREEWLAEHRRDKLAVCAFNIIDKVAVESTVGENTYH